MAFYCDLLLTFSTVFWISYFVTLGYSNLFSLTLPKKFSMNLYCSSDGRVATFYGTEQNIQLFRKNNFPKLRYNDLKSLKMGSYTVLTLKFYCLLPKCQKFQTWISQLWKKIRQKSLERTIEGTCRPKITNHLIIPLEIFLSISTLLYISQMT